MSAIHNFIDCLTVFFVFAVDVKHSFGEKSMQKTKVSMTCRRIDLHTSFEKKKKSKYREHDFAARPFEEEVCAPLPLTESENENISRTEAKYSILPPVWERGSVKVEQDIVTEQASSMVRINFG